MRRVYGLGLVAAVTMISIDSEGLVGNFATMQDLLL